MPIQAGVDDFAENVLITNVYNHWKTLREFCGFLAAGARFSKVPIINRLVKLLMFTCKKKSFNTFASNMIKLPVNETKWTTVKFRK